MVMTAFILICVFVMGVTNGDKIPNYIHVCRRSDPNVVRCVSDSIEHLRPRLMQGIPELDVPGLEPLHIKDIVVASGAAPSNFKLLLKNIDVTGASNFKITKLKLDIPNTTYRVAVSIPLLQLVGTYDVNARVLVVPIKGQGLFTANATDCAGNGVLRGKRQQIDGKEYLRFTDLDLKLQIGDYKVRLDNFRNGDPIISQAANEVLNQNRKDFIEIAKPYIQSKVSEILLVIANKIVKNFEYDQVFPA